MDETDKSRLEAVEEALTTDQQILKDILSQLNGLHDLFAGLPPALTGEKRVEEFHVEDDSPHTQPVADALVIARRHGKVVPPPANGQASSLSHQGKNENVQTLITSESMRHVLSRLAAAMGPAQRSAIIERVAAEWLLTSTQLASLLSHLKLAAERESAARQLAPCLVDRENCADALLPVFARLPRRELQRVLQCATTVSTSSD